MVNNVQATVHSLIRKYIERQEIVREALSELRPDLLLLSKAGISPQELIEAAKRHTHVPQTGRWGEEWLYTIHGKGCRLIHTVTQEPLEWDAGDVKSFDRFWFVNHLNWLLSQNIDEAPLSELKSRLSGSKSDLQRLVFDALSQLEQIGLIVRSSPSNPNKYTLLVENSP